MTEATATEATTHTPIARRERRNFTPEFKAQACERIRQGASYVDVSSDLKIHEHLLREWTKKAGVRRGDALRPTSATTPQTVGESSKGVKNSAKPKKQKRTNSPERRANPSNESDRIRILAEENRALKEENDFLQRVARMFAREAPSIGANTGRQKAAAHG